MSEWGAQFLPYPLLPEAACGDSHSLTNCRTQFLGKALEFFVSLSVYPNARTRHTNQYTKMHASVNTSWFFV